MPRARSRGRRSRVTARKSSRRGPGLSLLPPPRLGPTGSWPPPWELRAPSHASPGTWHCTAWPGRTGRRHRAEGSWPSGAGVAPRSLLGALPAAQGLCQPQTSSVPAAFLSVDVVFFLPPTLSRSSLCAVFLQSCKAARGAVQTELTACLGAAAAPQAARRLPAGFLLAEQRSPSPKPLQSMKKMEHFPKTSM